MSVITFYGNDKIETAQTTSMAAIATYLSIKENYKMLLINTSHNDDSLQECFWEQAKGFKPRSDLETGISGLIKAISSNKATPEIITNYTRTVFKDRLEVLTDGYMPRDVYIKQREYMKSIIKIAKKYYDLVFVDLKGNIEEEFVQGVLEESNLIVANTSQRKKYIEEFITQRRTHAALAKNNIVLLIGKYDKYSKYNIRNLQRKLGMGDIYGIPYNTLFFEVCNEGNLADFVINYRNVRETSVQASIMEALSITGEGIIEKLKQLQLEV